MHTLVGLRRTGLLALYCILFAGGLWIGHVLFDIAGIEIRPSNEPAVHLMIMTTLAIFAIASALPFVPGAEIGLALMLAFGGEIALLVYSGMVSALLAAYLVGRLVPLALTASALRLFGFARAHDLVLRLGTVAPSEWAEHLTAGAPRRFVPFLLRHRHAALALLFNLPGNSLLGGGGGIALAAGLSRLFSLPGYVATVAIAVAPVPLAFMFTH